MENILKIKNYILEHRLKSALIIVIIISGGYWAYNKINPTTQLIQYIAEAVRKSTITVSVSGSGQVLELNKMDLKPLSSGNIVAVNVKNGDIVKSGQSIAVIDRKESLVALNQARASLLSARANYDKLAQGATESDIRLSENSVKQAELNYQNEQKELADTKKSAAQTVAQAQKTLDDLQTLDTQNIPNNQRDALIATLGDKLFMGQTALDSENKVLTDDNLKNIFSVKNSSYSSNTKNDYNRALILLAGANADLTTVKGDKSDANIAQAADSVIETLNITLSSLDNCYNALQNSITSSAFSQTSLDAYKSSISGQVSSISSAIASVKASYQDFKDAIVTAQDDLDAAKTDAEQQISSGEFQTQSSYNSWQSAIASLDKLKTPVTVQDLEISRAQIISAQAQYDQAKNNYDNNIIVAPFDGQVAAINIQKMDQVTPSTVIATIITKQQIVTVSLNEVDVAKIKLNQKAILTFDAIDGLSITGKVGQIDTVGTISQNVVTYNTQISMDIQDDRIRSGMSANVEIITDAKADVLIIPNAALKSDSLGNYVQILDANGKPQRNNVQIGIANDLYTEITGGLNEGDKVIIQTINPNAATNSGSGANSGGGLRIPGLGGR